MGKLSNNSLIIIFFFLGFTWLRSSWGKITGGKFVDGLAGTLGKLSVNNPFLWYKDFLQNAIIPNSKIFGYLIMWGEFLTAASITLATLYLLLKKDNRLAFILLILGLSGGAFLNALFWLASSHTGAATDSLNLMMFVIEISGILFALKNLKTRTAK